MGDEVLVCGNGGGSERWGSDSSGNFRESVSNVSDMKDPCFSIVVTAVVMGAVAAEIQGKIDIAKYSFQFILAC